jgi:hypothetical protein
MYYAWNTETYQETFQRHIDIKDGKYCVLKSGNQGKKSVKLQDENKFVNLTRDIGILSETFL